MQTNKKAWEIDSNYKLRRVKASHNKAASYHLSKQNITVNLT